MLDCPALDVPCPAEPKGDDRSPAETIGHTASSVSERGSETYVPRDKRLVTMLLLARLETATRDGLTRIRNVSTGGAMVETSLSLITGEPIRLETRDLLFDGRIAWSKDGRAGIEFSGPADVTALMHPAASGRANYVVRAPRLLTECTVRLQSHGLFCSATLLDISARGGRLLLDRPLSIDGGITITIPGLDPQQAAVRWVNGEEAGVTLLSPIPFAKLEGWLQDTAVRFGAREPGKAQS
jgi:hypothetical protein